MLDLADAQPALQNGDVESNNTPWSTDAFVPAAAVFTWDSTEAFTGTHSLKIESTSDNDARWYQTVAVTPNTDYRFCGWVKTQNVTHTSEYYDAGANLSVMGGFAYVAGPVGTTDWQELCLDFNSASNTTVDLAVRIGMYSGVAMGTAWFDDLRLLAVGADGLTEPHQVGIWTSSQQLLVSATVPPGTVGALASNFRYVPVPLTVLRAGQSYVIGAFYSAGSGDVVASNGGLDLDFNFDPRVVFAEGREDSGVSGFGFPATAASPSFGPNFLIRSAFNVTVTTDATDAVAGDGVCDDGSGHCTLRAAIQEANASPGQDVITLPAGIFTLTIPGAGEQFAATGDLDIRDDLTLIGDPSSSVIDGGGLDRVFEVLSGHRVNFSHLTVRNGSETSGGGGGIHTFGDLTLTNCVVAANTTTNLGGGIRSTTSATLTLVESSVNGNSAAGSGGGIMMNQGTATLIGTTVSGNSASSGDGGGIKSLEGQLTLVNSTVSGNSAPSGAGGGLLASYTGSSPTLSLTLSNSTITANSAAAAGGVRALVGSRSSVRNTIIAGNTAGTSADCIGELTSQGYNLIENTTGCAIAGVTTGNVTGAPANLAVLANNGGPTQTHALLAGSPAIDAGNPAAPGSGGIACEAADQRGAIRPPLSQGRCDIGAYEGSIAVGNTCGNGLVEPTDSPPNCDAGSAAITVDSSGGSVQTPDQTVALTVPPQAVPESVTLTLAAAGGSSLTAANIIAGPPGQSFGAPVTFTFRWADADGDGYVDTGTCAADPNQTCDADADCGDGGCSVHTATTSELDLVLKRDGDRFGSHGFDSGPFRCGDHLSGDPNNDCTTAVANCADPAGTGLASVAKCCDPASNTWTFQTCHFSNYLAGTRAADLVPGKGSPSTDCQAEWGLRNADNHAALEKGKEALGILNFQQVCTDGDPLCDSDQTANGTCVFDLKVALNVTDPRLQDKKGQVACAPFEMQTWKLLTPKPDSKNTIDQQNAVELINAVKALGLPVVGGKHSESLDFAPPVNGEPDSRRARVSVPLKGKKHDKPGVKIIKAQTITPPSPGTTKPIKDTDTLKLVCNPPTK